MARLRRTQQGLALGVVLMLITMSVLVALAGMGNAVMNERIAGNQRQIAETFMAAEAGLIRAAAWWQEQEDGQRNDVRYWGDAEGAMSVLAGLNREPRPGLQWSIRDLDFVGNVVTMVSVGSVDGAGTLREVGARYQRPAGVQGAPPAPLAFGGPVEEVVLAGDGALRVVPGADDSQGPAIVTASEEDAQHLQAALTPEQLLSLPGGIETDDNDPGFADATLLQALVEAIAQSPGVSDGPIPWDFGQPDNPAANIVRGVAGEPVDLVLSGKVGGTGILIVTGSLYFEEPPDFTGIIVVLGPSLEFGEGSGDVHGGLLMHYIADTTAETWSSQPAGSRFHTQGSVDIHPGGDVWVMVQALLSPQARALWNQLSGRDIDELAGRFFGWFETPRL